MTTFTLRIKINIKIVEKEKNPIEFLLFIDNTRYLLFYLR